MSSHVIWAIGFNMEWSRSKVFFPQKSYFPCNFIFYFARQQECSGLGKKQSGQRINVGKVKNNGNDIIIYCNEMTSL